MINRKTALVLVFIAGLVVAYIAISAMTNNWKLTKY
jgi:hypothetical protein